MLTDRTLLHSTLALTFAAGCASGFAAGGGRDGAAAAFRPHDARHVYARELAVLRDEKGYDESEMAEAIAIHQQHLDAYKSWWDNFCVEHDRNLSVIDRKLDERRATLELKVAARRSGEQGR